MRLGTTGLIFLAARCRAYIGQFLTLEPGDVIATGTPGGVGFVETPARFLRSGDVLQTGIEGIGELKNTVYIDAGTPPAPKATQFASKAV